jgi:hypothetical protein
MPSWSALYVRQTQLQHDTDRGAAMDCTDLGDAVANYADLARLTAQKRDGRKAVIAAFAAKQKLTL